MKSLHVEEFVVLKEGKYLYQPQIKEVGYVFFYVGTVRNTHLESPFLWLGHSLVQSLKRWAYATMMETTLIIMFQILDMELRKITWMTERDTEILLVELDIQQQN